MARRVYKVYMVREDGVEVLLDRTTNKELAELRRDRYEREDNYERSIGYHVPDSKYIIK